MVYFCSFIMWGDLSLLRVSSFYFTSRRRSLSFYRVFVIRARVLLLGGEEEEAKKDEEEG